ncbi:MAG: D-glucuronyl C5-epimerase family protein [Gaiellaceae bacterium]
MRGRALIAATAVALSLGGAAPAASVTPVVRAALKALTSSRIDPVTRAQGRAEVRRASYLARTLPSGRREHVAVALGELAAFAGRLTQPRALTLIGQLKTNDDYFAKHYAPAPKTDVTDADGIVYRYFAGRCLEYHPLANFGALNARVAAGDADGAKRLADALVARGVYQHSGGIGWEYLFPFSGGRAPWLSGMAQAVAAQALARTAALVPEDGAMLMGKARAAYQAIPGQLLTSVAAGPWIRLYSFTSLQVLNAQLQAVISLQSYATTAEDDQAAGLALRMQRAAAATLARFDTGYWSYYALPHDPSPFDYHDFVVQLLKRLAPSDPRFADAAARFARYEKEPPAFMLANGPLGTLSFWLSKPATVSAVTAAGPSRRVSMNGGWHSLSWAEPKRPGIYPLRVTAADYAGNRTSFDSLPFVRATAAAAAARTTQAVRDGGSTFLAGTALDTPSQSSAAARLGLRLVRIGVAWPPGSAAPDPSLVAALQQVTPGLGTMIELNATPLPADDAGRAALAQYAASLASQVPSLHSLVLAPAATTATATAYGAAFTSIRAALPDTPVGLSVDGSMDAKGTLAALGGVDASLVAFRPAPAPGKGLLTLGDLAQLGTAWPIIVNGLRPISPAAVQTLGCTPGVGGVVLDRLADASGKTMREALTSAERGGIVCPGVAAQVQATTLEYPEVLAQALSITLACDRDCLYLATLERADGRPVVARRGELAGGAAPASIALPEAKLGAGSYSVRVRLVARVNPGAVATSSSPPLAR